MGLDASTINLSDPAFWRDERGKRLEAFEVLRRDVPVSWQDPPTAWASPQYPDPRGYWAITRHADIRAVSGNPTTFCSARGTSIIDNLPEEVEYAFSGFLSLDAPRHAQLRRLVSKAFTPRVLRNTEMWIRTQAESAVRRVAERGECDFYHDLVMPFPLGVICDMMGVPDADRPELVRLIQIVIMSWGSGTMSFADAIEACKQMAAIGLDLARRRRVQPKDDLTTELVRAEIDGRGLSDEDIGSFFRLMIGAGMETTATTAAHGMLALTQHPEQRARWQSQYEELGPTAVEEILRWAAPGVSMRRVATRETDIAGQAIADGDNVVLFYPSANHDDTVFLEPYRFDLSRSPNHHLTFGGGGPHFCLGAALARIELRAFFEELFRQLPDIEISAEPRPVPSPFFDTFESMPCEFTSMSSVRG